MLREPITLTLYNENSEPEKTFNCSVIPWGMLKKALAFQSLVSGDNVDGETFDTMGQFVCDLYRNQFTVTDLDTGADMVEVMSVIKAVLAYAGAQNPNV